MIHSFSHFLSFLLLLGLGTYLESSLFCRAAEILPSSGGALIPLSPKRAHNLPRHLHRLRASNTNATHNVVLTEKRDAGARFTYFKTGRGACGGFNVDSDFIVALNTHQWDNGAHCYETITVSYNGKSTRAQIVDKCMECPFNAIDLSIGLFKFFADLGQGTIFGAWSFGAAAQPAPSPAPTPTPKKTTSIVHTSSTRSTTQAVSSTSQAVSPSVVASTTSTVTPSIPTAVLEQLNLILVGFGNLVIQVPSFASVNSTSA